MGNKFRSSSSPKALAISIPMPPLADAMDAVRLSVDRFCLLAGVEALAEMMDEDATVVTEQQSECLDHEIQTNPQPTESYEIHWNLCFRKPQAGPRRMGPMLQEVANVGQQIIEIAKQA
jgi:glucosamine 6-phosphate synthetase-like amidotransferase/phosphosugar isomerase protein